jgi:hypothetical protein
MPDFEKDISEALVIHDEDLDRELKEQATKLFYWGSLWARAVKAERTQKLAVEALEAELSQKFRAKMLEENPKERVTEKMLKEYVTGHPTYQSEQSKLVQLGLVSDMFNVAKTAFESRGRMLLELAHRAAENKFYENQYRAMREEFERSQEEVARKRGRKKTVKEDVVEGEVVNEQ